MKRVCQRRMRLVYGLVMLTLAGAGGVAACGSPTSPSGNANLRLLLTDDPIEGLEKVNIHFTGVTAKPAGQPPEQLALDLQGNNPVDLLTLDDQVIGFATGVVTPGDFEFIHIDIDERQSHIVVNGEQKPLQVPSEEIKVLGQFTVDEDHMTTLTLDFDAAASIIQLGNGDFLLKPVIVITGNNTSSQP